MSLDTLYLLDTCIFIHAVRASNNSPSTKRGTWEKIKAACNPLMSEPRPLYSLVSKAELISFGRQKSWGKPKIDAATFYIDYFNIVDIHDESIIQAYAEIDTYSRFPPATILPKTSIKMGKNDLWIAATAYVLKATIVTTDKDFDHLHGSFVNRIYVEQAAGEDEPT